MADRYPREDIFERALPRIGVPEAVRRHKFLFVLPIIVLVGLALGYGLSRHPTYEAESRQTIGRIDVNQPGALAAFQSATESLASSYSRAVDANSVVDRVSRRTGLTEGQVRQRLSASPVPESPIFVVRGTGPSEREAIKLAQEGAAALRAYVVNLNSRNPDGGRLFRQVRRASLREARLREDVRRLRRARGPDPTPAQRRDVARAEARLNDASLAAQVAGQNYRTSQQSQANVSLVQALTDPRTATNDRFQALQVALFAALVLGVLMGIALATLRANQEVRRALSVN